MKAYKLRIFVRAVLARMEAEQITVDEALEDYTALSTEDKAQIKVKVLERQGGGDKK